MTATLEERVRKVVREHVDIVAYDLAWPAMFTEEKRHLLECLPNDLIGRIEHFGSTAVQGLAAKPVIDMLVEVFSLEETKTRIVPVLEAQGYDYFWRPTSGDDIPPFYAWFIKRGSDGRRTHHIHMVEPTFEHWERLLFRDYLIEFPEVAREYQNCKLSLAGIHGEDRIAYTKGKADFIEQVTRQAREYHQRVVRKEQAPKP